MERVSIRICKNQRTILTAVIRIISDHRSICTDDSDQYTAISIRKHTPDKNRYSIRTVKEFIALLQCTIRREHCIIDMYLRITICRHNAESIIWCICFYFMYFIFFSNKRICLQLRLPLIIIRKVR